MPGPENTPVAVRAALERGADGVELDVRRSRDLELVCIHDPLTGSDQGLRRTVFEADAAQLGLPSVAEMLDAAEGGRVVLEVKNNRRQPDYDGRRATTARLLTALLDERRSAGTADDVVVSSFDHIALVVARAGGQRTALLTVPGIPITAGLRRLSRGGHAELHAHVSALPKGMPRRAAAAVSRAHDEGISLIAWTVTSTTEALRLRDVGVDGVICDDPAAVVRALAEQ